MMEMRMDAKRRSKGPTVALLRATAKALNMCYRRNSEWREHQVNYWPADGGTEATCYHTDDSEDALQTMMRMASRRDKAKAAARCPECGQFEGDHGCVTMGCGGGDELVLEDGETAEHGK